MEELMQNTDNLTVLILAAGHGRRMGPFSRMVNKSLIPYNNKPLISHIMDKFSLNTRFVIACGNMGQQIKDYVSNVHSNRKISFVDIPEFDEHSTGPATTIRYCADHLPGGFMWITCDTLFEFDFRDKLDHNWIAVHPVDSTVSQDYCWIERNGNNITCVKNKIKSLKAVDAFIGLMYVKDTEYIRSLEAVNAKEAYEGFNADLSLKAYTVNEWKDFGTYEKWKVLSKELPELSFPKPDELFYQDNGKIIKYTTNDLLAKLRFERAMLNPTCMPLNVEYHNNFLMYDYAPGQTLYSCLTPRLFGEFMKWAETDLWIKPENFGDTDGCAEDFYYNKTMSRLASFRIKYSTWVEPSIVNGHKVKAIDEYLNDIDFSQLTSDTVWCFTHGDMQFDNIIYEDSTKKFTGIDWRTDFAGSAYGDLYYDLAKMLGGLYLSYKLVKEGKFGYKEKGNEVTIDVPQVEYLILYAGELQEWCAKRGYSWEKVKTLVPLIYLNMAPLHEAPFDKFLVALSQLFFSKL
jgi:NDP-sugar pyrophosphorylase family protein